MADNMKTMKTGLGLQPQSSDPTNPKEGDFQFADGTARVKGLWTYVDGDWQPVGSQGGTLDVFNQQDFETDVDSSALTSGNNASFDGGGTLDGTLSDETASPLNGRKSIKYIAGASSANDYFHTGAISIPEKIQNEEIEVSCVAKFSGAVDAVEFVLFDDDNNTIITSEAISSSVVKKYRLQTTLTGLTANIKVGFQVQGTIVAADELVFDDFEMKIQRPFSTAPGQVAFIFDEKSATTQGQSLTAGSWIKANLNTLKGDSGFITSLVSDEFTLPSGKYIFEVKTIGHGVNSHKSRLFNVTDAVVVPDSEGTTGRDASGDDNTFSHIDCIATLAATKTIRLEKYVQTTISNGGGQRSDAGEGQIERYTTIKITKVL